MAKCSICNSRKGKRECMGKTGFVCSQCCGETRQAEHCGGCGFYHDSKQVRRYTDVPRYSTMEMDSSPALQSCSNTIEGTLCVLDDSCQLSLTDAFALEIIELLLDKYHYKDADVSSIDRQLLEGYHMVLKSISEDLSDVPDEVIVKILGVIHFVAKRRTRGGREYFNVIHQYVGLRLGSGCRLLPNVH